MKNIAVVYGGFSSEEEISLKSGRVVANNLPADYKPYLVRINKKGWLLERNGAKIPIDKEDFSVEVDGTKLHFDMVFIAIHGTPGEDGKLQSYFDMIGVPYVSSNALACAITFNKWTCNSILKQYGYKCANAVVLRNPNGWDEKNVLEMITLPCFVKPNNGGSSFGISKVKKEDELGDAIKKAFEEGTEVMIEEFVAGTEVTCGVVKLRGKVTALPITEIVSENEFFDYEAKYKGASQEITPARISDEMTKEIQKQATGIFELLHLNGMARIDFIIQQDVPYVIEVNTVPGLSEESIVPQQARAAGMTLPELFGGLLEG